MKDEISFITIMALQYTYITYCNFLSGTKPTEEITEGGDLHEGASRRPTIFLAIPVLPHRWAQ